MFLLRAAHTHAFFLKLLLRAAPALHAEHEREKDRTDFDRAFCVKWSAKKWWVRQCILLVMIWHTNKILIFCAF